MKTEKQDQSAAVSVREVLGKLGDSVVVCLKTFPLLHLIKLLSCFFLSP